MMVEVMYASNDIFDLVFSNMLINTFSNEHVLVYLSWSLSTPEFTRLTSYGKLFIRS